jgi:fused signal recognition particle receptor
MRTFGEAPPPPTFFDRLKTGLSKTGLGDILTKKKLDAQAVAELEEALIRADMGAGQAARIAAAVARDRYDAEISSAELKSVLATEITALLAPIQQPLRVNDGQKPFVILVAGVNGSGKTTTIGKLAKRLAEEGAKVTLAAGDTFRAAAIEQLKVWADRARAQFVATKAGGDAAGLAFEALEKAPGGSLLGLRSPHRPGDDQAGRHRQGRHPGGAGRTFRPARALYRGGGRRGRLAALCRRRFCPGPGGSEPF